MQAFELTEQVKEAGGLTSHKLTDLEGRTIELVDLLNDDSGAYGPKGYVVTDNALVADALVVHPHWKGAPASVLSEHVAKVARTARAEQLADLKKDDLVQHATATLPQIESPAKLKVPDLIEAILDAEFPKEEK